MKSRGPKRVPLGPPDPRVERWQQEITASVGQRTFVDARKLSLRAWLRLLNSDDTHAFERRQFPTIELRDAFLGQIHRFPELTIHTILRNFLPNTATYGFDLDHLSFLLRRRARKRTRSYWREGRLLMHYVSNGRIPVWEGVHWVLGLLPHHPMMALDVLSAFFVLAAPYLSDSFLGGIEDSMSIIRMRYVVARDQRPIAERVVASLTHRQFEFLVAVALEQEGFETFVTPISHDGGVDIWAHSPTTLRAAVQCKHMDVVGVAAARELVGEIGHSSNLAILATSGRFTKGAASKKHRVRLIDGESLIVLLNGGLGIEWPRRIDRWLGEFQRKQQEAKRPSWMPPA